MHSVKRKNIPNILQMTMASIMITAMEIMTAITMGMSIMMAIGIMTTNIVMMINIGMTSFVKRSWSGAAMTHRSMGNLADLCCQVVIPTSLADDA